MSDVSDVYMLLRGNYFRFMMFQSFLLDSLHFNMYYIIWLIPDECLSGISVMAAECSLAVKHRQPYKQDLKIH